MGFKCGIVGLPNVGKSTLFNALTKAGIPAANYPFCTIDPNVGIVAVPDERLQKLTNLVKPQKVIATTMEFVDIAGLVAGAAQGEGLGNKFLSHIRETDAIAHVVRCFVNDDIIHVSGSVDPIRDIQIINTELALADLEAIERALQKAQKLSKTGDKKILASIQLFEQAKKHLDNAEPLRAMKLTEQDQEILNELHLLTHKPTVYIANVDEAGLTDNPYLEKLKKLAAEEGSEVVAVCAAIEAELAELNEEDKKEFLDSLGLTEPGLNRLIGAGYKLLGLQTYFTAGEKEVRAWTVAIGATAPQAAGVIHTDFEKGFIRAEVIAYDDYVKYGTEAKVKDAGRWRLEGKEYIVQDGDVMHFRFNV